MSWLMLLPVVWLPTWFVVFVLFMVANFRTHEDRMRIIRASQDRPATGGEILKALDRVSYNRHLLVRLFFRDPMLLYDASVRDAVENPRVEVMVAGPMVVQHGDGPPARMN